MFPLLATYRLPATSTANPPDALSPLVICSIGDWRWPLASYTSTALGLQHTETYSKRPGKSECVIAASVPSATATSSENREKRIAISFALAIHDQPQSFPR